MKLQPLADRGCRRPKRDPQLARTTVDSGSVDELLDRHDRLTQLHRKAGTDTGDAG
jgi:hypothetical protein